ncbi:hypothetical protein DCS_04089 [Drechmeria coniospora]|uniref:Nudix hydrolase domain-containing protein n=1 Tax=Drechmeria coniospora TaxID=98403 RepID=A0A151GJ91_DRECN|nr:hypothetical protein DCS_04089 [Drechmeria coniospora]KYK57082.1 hypothetical protein DCS_04089 [Drechmeria coniospora]ODA78984.1 hypothetical protein RJ55_04574 [Drechmeria coniospora]
MATSREPAREFTFDASVAPFSVSLKTYLATHPEFDAVATGGLIFTTGDPSTDTSGDGGTKTMTKQTTRRLLLIQRAAHDSMPSRWEVPGGACDPGDATLLHGLARELWEETGLVMRHIIARVGLGGAAGHDLGKGAEDGAVFFSRRGHRIIKYSFAVEVERPSEIVIDPNEHQRYLWATESECAAGRVGDVDIQFTMEQQMATIMEGFRLMQGSM